MKKIYLLIIAFICVNSIQAQISITSEDFADVDSSYVYISQTFENTNTQVLEDYLSGDVWDFSNIDGKPSDTIKFILPSSTPYASNFTESNLVTVGDDNFSYMFLKKTNDKVECLGVAGKMETMQNEIVFPFTENLTLFNFPVEQGDTDTENANFTIKDTPENLGINNLPINPDSIKIKMQLTINTNFDIETKAKLPTGTHNTIRQKQERISKINIFAKIPFIGWQEIAEAASEDTTYSYSWIAKGIGMPIAEINISKIKNNESKIPENYYISRVRYMQRSGNTANINNNKTQNFSLYPNPTKNNINVLGAENSQIQIFDITGKLIKKIQISDKNAKIDLSKFPNGMYFYRIIDLNNQIMKFGKLIKN